MRWLPIVAMIACTPPRPNGVEARDETVYPRIATYYIESYIDDTARQVMARSDVVIVDAEAAVLDRAPLEAVRAARPDGELLAYLTSEEVQRETAPERPLANARFSRVPASAWLVEPGSPLVAAIDATTSQLLVQNGAAFSPTRPPSAFYGEDEPTYLLVGNEHMKLVSVVGNTLTVERGYRSLAVPHSIGERVAAHVVFFGGTWMLNITEAAWRDALASEAVRLVADGPWTGVFLDVCFEDISWLNAGRLDLDRDGELDDKETVSLRWSAGMGALVDTLRTRLGPRVPIVSNPGAQNCPHPALDGILMEGWPIGMPPQYLAFDVGFDRYIRWTQSDPLTIANAFSPKIGFGTIEAGQDEVARTDYAAMRFGLGVTLMSNGFYTYDNGVFGHYVTWWYDEYDGAGRGLHWLGRAQTTMLVDGTLRWRVFDNGLAVVNLGDAPATFSVPPGYSKLAGTQDPKHNDGQPVERLVVPPRDAYLLVRR